MSVDGMELNKAKAKLEEFGTKRVRVVDVDEQSGKSTGDVDKDRVTLVVENNIVVASYRG